MQCIVVQYATILAILYTSAWLSLHGEEYNHIIENKRKGMQSSEGATLDLID